MVQPVTATTHIRWSRLNFAERAFLSSTPVDAGHMHRGRGESVGGDGGGLVGEFGSRRINAEGREPRTLPRWPLTGRRGMMTRPATPLTCNLPEKLMIDRSLLHGSKAYPSPVRVAPGPPG